MPSCWYVHTEQGDDSNSSPAAGLCSSAGLSDRVGGGHHASIAAPFWDHRDATSGGGWMLSFYSEGGKELSVSARHPEHLHSACGSGAALLLWTLRKKKLKKKKKVAHTDQTKAAEHRAALSLPSPQQVPESSLERGGLATVLSRPPWGHLPLMRILIYAGAFKAILIGCIVALYDSSSTHMVLVGVCCFPSLFVFWVFLFFFFARSFVLSV